METLEFIIHPDGRVEEKVTGIKGMSCTEVTEKIEEQLGCVIAHEETSEFFSQVTVESSSSVSAHTTQGHW
ncbi:MAG: DUF2997 domain-containing protein [Cyanobacteria bacterium P01_E01_bin.6]